MAVTEFADFLKSVRSTYSDVVSDGIFEANVIFKEIQKSNGRPKEYDGIIGGKGGFWKNVGGNSFQWRLLYDTLDMEEWGPGSTVTAITPDVLKNMEDTMGGYRIGYFVDMFETLSMNTREQFIPLLRLYEKLAARKWESGFEEKMFKNSTSGGWHGFPAWFGTITGTPGTTSGTYPATTGVDLSQSYASPAIFNYSGSGQSFALTCLDRVDQVSNAATHGDTQEGPNAPNLALLGRTDWNTVKSTIYDQHRLVNVNTEMLKFGFVNFEYSGIRFYWSDEMERQGIRRVYLLNTNHIGIAHAGPKLFISETATAITGQVGVVAMSFSKSQLFNSNTRKQGVIDNVNLS